MENRDRQQKEEKKSKQMKKSNIHFFVALVVFHLTLLTSFTTEAAPTPSKASENIQHNIELMQRGFKNNQEEIAILRRDQINYRMEKDLLKEAFASNLQSINVIVAILFGFIGILGAIFGYLGFKSIETIKADYRKELDTLRILKTKLENDIKAILEQQATVKNEVLNITEINEKQDRRLKVLEIIEKVGSHYQNRQFAFALKYIAIGLDLDPDNISLMTTNASCHGKLGEWNSAIESSLHALKLEPDSMNHLQNLAEFYLLAHRVDEFNKLYEENKARFDKENDGALSAYLKTLCAFVKGNIADMKEAVSPYVMTATSGAGKRIGQYWSFDEVNLVFNAAPDSPLKSLMKEIINFFQGSQTTEAIKLLLQT